MEPQQTGHPGSWRSSKNLRAGLGFSIYLRGQGTQKIRLWWLSTTAQPRLFKTQSTPSSALQTDVSGHGTCTNWRVASGGIMARGPVCAQKGVSKSCRSRICSEDTIWIDMGYGCAMHFTRRLPRPFQGVELGGLLMSIYTRILLIAAATPFGSNQAQRTCTQNQKLLSKEGMQGM